MKKRLLLYYFIQLLLAVCKATSPPTINNDNEDFTYNSPTNDRQSLPVAATSVKSNEIAPLSPSVVGVGQTSTTTLLPYVYDVDDEMLILNLRGFLGDVAGILVGNNGNGNGGDGPGGGGGGGGGRGMNPSRLNDMELQYFDAVMKLGLPWLLDTMNINSRDVDNIDYNVMAVNIAIEEQTCFRSHADWKASDYAHLASNPLALRLQEGSRINRNIFKDMHLFNVPKHQVEVMLGYHRTVATVPTKEEMMAAFYNVSLNNILDAQELQLAHQDIATLPSADSQEDIVMLSEDITSGEVSVVKSSDGSDSPLFDVVPIENSNSYGLIPSPEVGLIPSFSPTSPANPTTAPSSSSDDEQGDIQERDKKNPRLGSPMKTNVAPGLGLEDDSGAELGVQFQQAMSPPSQEREASQQDDDVRLNDRLVEYLENEDVCLVEDDISQNDDVDRPIPVSETAGDISEAISNVACEFEDLAESDTALQEYEIPPLDASSTMFGDKRFVQDLNKLLDDLQHGRLDDQRMRKAVAEFMQYANDLERRVKAGDFNNASVTVIKQLETELNNKRKGLIAVMRDTLPNEYRHLINMAHQFSSDTVILFILHYAPVGVRHADNDIYDFTRNDQCCIHTMKKKLYNFLVNDNAKLDMTNYQYGGKTNEDMSSKMAVVDMIPMLLEKSDKEVDMIRQYQKYADLLKLDSFYELIGISHTMARLHLLLHRVSHPTGKKCQVHVASSAAAKHMFGLKAGPSKYFAKIVHNSFTITFGPHPQVYLMGLCKSLRMFPREVQDIIAKHLVEVYSNVAEFSEDFVTQLMQVFGGEYSDGVDLGLYSRLAKLLQESDLLDMDTSNAADIDIDMDQEEKTNHVVAHYSSILQGKGWDQVDIELVAVELKSVSIELFMSRMRRFRGGADLHGIAARLPENCSISDSVKQQIIELTELLKRGYRSILNSLKKIKQNQTRGGDRLTLLKTLAAKYNNDNNSITDKDKMDLVKLLAPGRTPSDALQMIKNTAAELKRNGERVTLLNTLAAKYINDNNSITDKDLKELVKLLGPGRTPSDALQMIKNMAEKLGDYYGFTCLTATLHTQCTTKNKNKYISDLDSLDDYSFTTGVGTDATSTKYYNRLSKRYNKKELLEKIKEVYDEKCKETTVLKLRLEDGEIGFNLLPSVPDGKKNPIVKGVRPGAAERAGVVVGMEIKRVNKFDVEGIGHGQAHLVTKAMQEAIPDRYLELEVFKYVGYRKPK